MKNRKLSPKDRKNILVRVEAGEKQVDIAKEFGISKGYLSKVLKYERSRVYSSAEKREHLQDFSEEQLRNYFKGLEQQLDGLYTQHASAWRSFDKLQMEITSETERLKYDESESGQVSRRQLITAMRGRATHIQKHSFLEKEIAAVYVEMSIVLGEFKRRGTHIRF